LNRNHSGAFPLTANRSPSFTPLSSPAAAERDFFVLPSFGYDTFGLTTRDYWSFNIEHINDK
jgi:hypothetical protein